MASRRPKRGDKGGGPKVTKPKDLAAAMKVRVATVYTWRKIAGFPGGKKGPWLVADVRAWSKKRRSRSAVRGEPSMDIDSDDDPVEGAATKEQIAAVSAALRALVSANAIPKTLLNRVVAGLRNPTAAERFRMAKAELTELKLEQERGDLVERTRVEAMLISRCSLLKRDFLRLPRTVATILEGKKERHIQATLQKEIDTILAKFVRKQGLHDLLNDDTAA